MELYIASELYRADYGSTSTQRKGVYGPITSLLILLTSPQGPDVRLQKMFTLLQGIDAAARAVIGLLTKTCRRTKD